MLLLSVSEQLLCSHRQARLPEELLHGGLRPPVACGALDAVHRHLRTARLPVPAGDLRAPADRKGHPRTSLHVEATPPELAAMQHPVLWQR